MKVFSGSFGKSSVILYVQEDFNLLYKMGRDFSDIQYAVDILVWFSGPSNLFS